MMNNTSSRRSQIQNFVFSFAIFISLQIYCCFEIVLLLMLMLLRVVELFDVLLFVLLLLL
jgi:hypothetical protein